MLGLRSRSRPLALSLLAVCALTACAREHHGRRGRASVDSGAEPTQIDEDGSDEERDASSIDAEDVEDSAPPTDDATDASVAPDTVDACSDCAPADAAADAPTTACPEAGCDAATTLCASEAGVPGCRHLDAPCVLGVCDPTQGCVLQADPTCDCDDDNPCTDDSVKSALQPGEQPCRHQIHVCADDGIGCTVETCDPQRGCEHVPDPDECEVDLRCNVPRCSATAGCDATPLADGTLCGWESCGRAERCMQGACVIVGTSDPACDAWFTPGDNGMLPWAVPACGSATGQGLDVYSRLDSYGIYSVDFSNDLRVFGDDRLMYGSGYGAARVFDGQRWTPPHHFPKLPTELDDGWWRVLGSNSPDELVLIREVKDSCVQVLRGDLRTGQFTPWAASMFADDPCEATQLTQTRWYDVYLGTDGQLWTFTYKGLMRFEGQTWKKQPFPDEAAGWPQPQLIFDEKGLAWVVRTKTYPAWRRGDNGFEPVIGPHNFWSFGDAVRTPRDTLLLSTQTSVVELTGSEIIEYPPVPQTNTRYGVETIGTDAYGRPIAGTDYHGWERYLFEGGQWRSLGFFELMVVDAQRNVYFGDVGRVTRLAGQRRVPVGPQSAHRSLSRPRTVWPYDLRMKDGPKLTWVETGWWYPARSYVNVRETALQKDGQWSTRETQLGLSEGQERCTSFARYDSSLRSYGARTLVACSNTQFALLAGDQAIPVVFETEHAPVGSSATGLTSAMNPDGSIALLYLSGTTGQEDMPLVLAQLGSDGRVTAAEPVPDALMHGVAWQLNTPRLQLLSSAQGLVVLWLDYGPELADRVAHGKVRTAAGWKELGAVPEGYAFVDATGQLWVAASTTSAAQTTVIPTRWTGSAWEPATGGAPAGVFANTMTFDRDGNPIVAVRLDTNSIGVVRHLNGSWQPIHDSMRPFGVTNSQCSESRSPLLAREDDLLCLSWLEPVESAFELLLRCTRLE